MEDCMTRQNLPGPIKTLAKAGMIAETDDVFWLIEDEVLVAAARLDVGEPITDLYHLVSQRKAVWRSARRAAAPIALPQIKIFGKK